jgi:hypothetical protein
MGIPLPETSHLAEIVRLIDCTGVEIVCSAGVNVEQVIGCCLEMIEIVKLCHGMSVGVVAVGRNLVLCSTYKRDFCNFDH